MDRFLVKPTPHPQVKVETTIEAEPIAGDTADEKELAASPPASLAGVSAPTRRVHENPHWVAATCALDAHGQKRKRAALDDACADDAALASMPLVDAFDHACVDDAALAAMPLP